MKVIGTAISGEDAVEMYERHRPDVVMERKFPNGTWAEWRKLYTLSA
jgi:hypothetical protein